MSVSDTEKIEVVYRRWVILVPILLFLVGSIMFSVIGPSNKAIGLMGGIIAFIAVLTFGVIFSVMVGLEMASRTLENKTRPRSSFREKIESNEQRIEEHQHNES